MKKAIQSAKSESALSRTDLDLVFVEELAETSGSPPSLAPADNGDDAEMVSDNEPEGDSIEFLMGYKGSFFIQYG